MTDKKLNIVIRSDGTLGGTSLTLNGKDVTKDEDVIDVSFNADGESGRPWISFSYAQAKRDDKGARMSTRTAYNYRPELSAPTSTGERLPPLLVGKDEEIKNKDAVRLGSEIPVRNDLIDKIVKLKPLLARDFLEARTTDSLRDKLADLEAEAK